ncbi:hypothetical protein Trydic_g9021 [Trypoxylus dichotomus]
MAMFMVDKTSKSVRLRLVYSCVSGLCSRMLSIYMYADTILDQSLVHAKLIVVYLKQARGEIAMFSMLLAVLGFLVSVSANGLELPSFIPKCSLSDPNLGDCIKEKANMVIPIIAKGIPEFGIPSVSPLLIPEAKSEALHVIGYDVYNDDLKDFKVTEASFNLTGKAKFTLYLDRFQAIAQNYTFTNDMLLGLPVTGHGKFNFTVVGITVNYIGDIKTYEKDGDTYVDLVNGEISSNIKRGYYYYDNIQSPNERDVNEYLDDHWQDYRIQQAREKRAMFSILLTVLGFLVLASAGGLELPSFIPKCSLSDPNLGDCIKEKANIVIPQIAKGVPEFGIPPLSPLSLPEAKAEALDLIVNDVYIGDLKDFKVTKASLDFKSGKADFSIYLDRLHALSQNYTFSSGMLLGLPVTGHGKYNATILGISVNYTGDIKTYEKDGDTYVDLVNGKIFSDVVRGYYHFENIQSPKEKDVNRYIDDHWQDYRIKLKPAMDLYLAKFIHTPFAKIFSSVPLNKIFLP